MKLENNFTIDAPVEKAWEALNSPETVAPCFPGATLTEYEGDSFTGTVKVKLGPIAMTYKGKGTYVSRDDAAHKVVIEANGRDSRGNGTASATVTASLAADGPDKTAVSMETNMTITGKPAQFGRGVISDVADKIIGQFSACVARKLAAQEDTAAGSTEGGSAAEAPVAASAASAPASSAASAASEAISDIATPPAGAKRSAPAPAGGSEAISDTVSERSAATNGAAPGPATGTPVTPATPSGTSEAEAPASATRAPGPATTTPVTPATTTVRSAAPRSQAPVRSEVDAIDLLDTAGAPVLKRLAPVAGGALLLLLVILLVRRLRSV
jgi:carbon monoxide dehydrogenase subunit G